MDSEFGGNSTAITSGGGREGGTSTTWGLDSVLGENNTRNKNLINTTTLDN